jgi:hypothetical protein
MYENNKKRSGTEPLFDEFGNVESSFRRVNSKLIGIQMTSNRFYHKKERRPYALSQALLLL